VTLSANLPATPTPGTATATIVPPATTASPLASQITVYDALGTAHMVTLNWTQNPDPITGIAVPGDWNVQIQSKDSISSTPGSPASAADTDAGTARVQFGAASGSAVPEGTIGQISQPTTTSTSGSIATIATLGYSTGKPATLDFTTDFGSGPQKITLNLGTYGSSSGVTQFAGSAYDLLGLTQDGVPPGSFAGVTAEENGSVIVNYNNGQTRTIAQIPVVTFNAPNALQSQNGQAFTATPSSGTPLAEAVGTNGAGTLVTGSVEGSNVDIASEFSQLIIAQQAYSSNAKVVTTANAMLQATLQMVA
jgi:flagellar hook protein FlgE